MPKSKKHGITFDSDWEVFYWEKLTEEKINFIYHPSYMPLAGKSYEPDFLEYDDGVVTLIEIKSTYNPYSRYKDDQFHMALKNLVKYEQDTLIKYCQDEFMLPVREVKYRKIKFLKKHGFVDFSFKSPTLKDAWKKKATELEEELKSTNKELKDYKRYVAYLQKAKLTKPQREWLAEFERKNEIGDRLL